MFSKIVSAGLVFSLAWGAVGAAKQPTQQFPSGDSGIPAPAPLLANDEAATVLNCFHPEGAIFVSESGKKRTCSGNPCAIYEGTIDFKGILSKNAYWMEFQIQQKTDDDGTKYMRVVPTSDNAPIPPSDTCKLRRWREVK